MFQNVAELSVFVRFFAANLLAEASVNVRPCIGMEDAMDRNIWDIMGEVKPSVNCGPYNVSGVAPSADQKSSSTKNSA